MVLPPDHGDPSTDTLDALLLDGMAALAAIAPVGVILLCDERPVHRWLQANALGDRRVIVIEALTRLEARGAVEQAAPGLYRLVAGVRAS